MEEICVKIVDGVYLGSYKTSMSRTTLSARNISHILCVGSEMENILREDYKFMKLDVTDTEDENILFNFESVFNFIEDGKSQGGVLIHCYGGISRSPTIVIAYLMKKNMISFEQAFNTVKELKSDINPNEGFLQKLQIFEKIVNKPIEFYYKCSMCRKTLFDDSNIDFIHEFSPQTKFSYKRYKKSFVNNQQGCSSFFLNSLAFLNTDLGGKIMCPGKNVYFIYDSAKIKLESLVLRECNVLVDRGLYLEYKL